MNRETRERREKGKEDHFRGVTKMNLQILIMAKVPQ
jgi:hypothetical protein